jgi:hypothetical protein
MRGSSLTPRAYGPGACGSPNLPGEIAAATAFVLLVGEEGIGPPMEYYEALDRPTPRVTGFAYLPI